MWKKKLKVKQDAEFGNLVKRLAGWKIPEEALEQIHNLARVSLDEVKALTEYEDGKVSRLLTVVAFLSAVVAAIFGQFASNYAVPALTRPELTIAWAMPLATYILFLIYVVLVTYSVWKAIGAIRPKFEIPATWTDGSSRGDPTSMIFYKGILDVGPLQWGRTFEEYGEKGAVLKEIYAKHYIAEAYLVARKVADKLELLKWSVRALRSALVFLLLFFLAYGCTIFSLEPTRTPAATSVGPWRH